MPLSPVIPLPPKKSLFSAIFSLPFNRLYLRQYCHCHVLTGTIRTALISSIQRHHNRQTTATRCVATAVFPVRAPWPSRPPIALRGTVRPWRGLSGSWKKCLLSGCWLPLPLPATVLLPLPATVLLPLPATVLLPLPATVVATLPLTVAVAVAVGMGECVVCLCV
jgi:hypothetical protein